MSNSASDENRAKPVIYLSDYQPSPWLLEKIELVFDLHPENTMVTSRLVLQQREASSSEDLRLDGEGIELLELRVDGKALTNADYQLDAKSLTIPGVRGRVIVETRSQIHPSANKTLQGLYLSGSIDRGFLLTQCEAEGFRNITWSLDRPDVLAVYDVTLRADRERFPVLLAGGNSVGAGVLEGGRHWVRYIDPQPKPSYLFALVAGKLECIEDHFTTARGMRVRLLIWAEADAIDRCRYAMSCLKAAFAWDEERFGRSYTLDTFHIVVTHDFAMGAMENTGLNIFNSKYVLADAEHATDDDFRHVLAVIGHEYFHHWSGNRVTCRDWFQLSLKEGLTVYREQEFESDVGSRSLRRIEDVRTLWRAQFPEDAGPLAHPVRPAQYSEINNFYTATIYDKGAEIVRMLATLLGRDGFRKGMDLYFERHDGEAVTVEDFLAALGDANGCDLSPWLSWYRQAGTPVVVSEGHYDEATRSYDVRMHQLTPPTPSEAAKSPLPIPLALALFDSEGNALPIVLDAEGASIGNSYTYLFDQEQATLRFHQLEKAPVVSLLRGFSAPVRLQSALQPPDLAVLAMHESDGFNRWFAADTLARLSFDDVLASGRVDSDAYHYWSQSLLGSLGDDGIDPATVAEMLTLADETILTESASEVDPYAAHRARADLERTLAKALEPKLLRRYEQLAPASEAGSESQHRAERRMRNRCLALLGLIGHTALAVDHYRNATCLSDRLCALTTLVHGDASEAEDALADFAARYASDPLVMDKWFAVQASRPHVDGLAGIDALTAHVAFRWDNPNKVYAVFRTLAQSNTLAFHRADGAGYRFVADAILKVDAITPQVSARLATAFGGWRRLEPARRAFAQRELARIAASRALSPDLADIVGRSLAES